MNEKCGTSFALGNNVFTLVNNVNKFLYSSRFLTVYLRWYFTNPIDLIWYGGLNNNLLVDTRFLYLIGNNIILVNVKNFTKLLSKKAGHIKLLLIHVKILIKRFSFIKLGCTILFMDILHIKGKYLGSNQKLPEPQSDTLPIELYLPGGNYCLK